VSGSFDHQPTWSLLLEIKKGNEIQKIFISETTGPIETPKHIGFIGFDKTYKTLHST
jgi:hypothetical protein